MSSPTIVADEALRTLLIAALSRTATRVLLPYTRALGLPDVTWSVNDHGDIVGRTSDLTVIKAYAESMDMLGYLIELHGSPVAEVHIAGRWLHVVLGGAS